VNTHLQVAKCLFGTFRFPISHQAAQPAFRTEMALGLVSTVCVGCAEVYLILFPSSLSADS